MSDTLYFVPAIGLPLTQLGLSSSEDNYHNWWSGNMVACANRDRSSIALRTPPEPVSPTDLLTLMRPFNGILSPREFSGSLSRAARYVATGTYELGSLESPLETICNERRAARAGATRE